VLDSGWYIYSLTQKPGGPTPMSVTLEPSPPFTLVGNVIGPQPVVIFDKEFGIDTERYTGAPTFAAIVSIASGKTGHESADLKVRTRLVMRRFVCRPHGEAHHTRENREPMTSFLWLAAVTGALSLLTPCVFPMIPITVTYFGGNANRSRAAVLGDALLFAGGIVVTFTALGLGLALLVGASGLAAARREPMGQHRDRTLIRCICAQPHGRMGASTSIHLIVR
jgi:hypothetical protein